MSSTANPLVRAVAGPAEDLALDPGQRIATLRDGRTVRVRRVRADDGPAIQAFLEKLSPNARRLRFFSGAVDLPAMARWAASGDAQDHVGLVAFDGEHDVVGHAAYVRMYGPRAEVSVEVADDIHHLGLGTRLIVWLARVGEEHGITHFVAEVLADNSEMLSVFHDGFAPIQRRESGLIEIEFLTSSWRLAQQRLGGGLGAG
jgi:L-amino acid N-acyltransferase YncA